MGNLIPRSYEVGGLVPRVSTERALRLIEADTLKRTALIRAEVYASHEKVDGFFDMVKYGIQKLGEVNDTAERTSRGDVVRQMQSDTAIAGALTSFVQMQNDLTQKLRRL